MLQIDTFSTRHLPSRRFLKISSSRFASPSRMIPALCISSLPLFVRYPPILDNSCFQILNKVSIAPSLNRWSVLDKESAIATARIDVSRKHSASSSSFQKLESESSGSVPVQQQGNANFIEVSEVVDDWEKAYE